MLPRSPDSLDAIIGGWIPSRQSPCFVKVQRSCLSRKPLLLTAMPSTVGTRRRFSRRFVDAHAAPGRPEVRYLRVVIVTMYSQQAVGLCVVTDRRGNSSDVSHLQDVIRANSRSVKKRWWESNPLKPGCSRPPSHLAPAFCCSRECRERVHSIFVPKSSRHD